MDDVHDEEQTWQPISALPMLTAHAAEGVRLAREHLDLLGEASPYRLDDATVAREIATWQTTRDDLDQLFAEQGRRWQQQAQGTRHEGEVEHYRATRASTVSGRFIIIGMIAIEQAGRSRFVAFRCPRPVFT